MSSPKQLLVLILVILCWSCKKTSKYPYAIKDFRSALQPLLTKAVEDGIVGFAGRDFREMATDRELIKLGLSEHPILRATAFEEMLRQKSFNHFQVLMGHLDDTAMVWVDAGEFGVDFKRVSDHILWEARWKTEDERNKTIDQVLKKHNYLYSAYLILEKIEPQEKYYTLIKDMATRPRRLDPYEGYELGFGDTEYALYGLAKFRKRNDIGIIKKRLMEHVWKLSEVSFRLMREYPDTSYLEILQEVHRRKFYNFSGDDRGGFTGNPNNRFSSKDFIETLVVQQNEQSHQNTKRHE